MTYNVFGGTLNPAQSKAASCHIGFSNSGNLNGCQRVEGRDASACQIHQNRSSGCRDITIFW